jgi:kynurenine formamidase
MPDGEGRLPSYRELPLDETKPPGSAWGVFGEDDQVGTLNLLTPERVAHAATLVRKGSVFSLNWNLELPDPPLSGRGSLRHTLLKSDVGTDDYYDSFYPQRSSQWDALAHMGHPEYGFYNGCTLAEITGHSGSRNGIDHWARRGIAGRFVLADIAARRLTSGRPIDPGSSEIVTVDEVEETLAAQSVSLGQGDILLLRFGWISWYERLAPEERRILGEPPHRFRAVGLAPGEETAAWLWDRHLAAVVADCPALEVHPVDFSNVERCLHYRVIPLLGLAVAELVTLDALAVDCARDGVYEGFFVAAPLNKVGGSGSPANAVALK